VTELHQHDLVSGDDTRHLQVETHLELREGKHWTGLSEMYSWIILNKMKYYCILPPVNSIILALACDDEYRHLFS
jgi:hypothetical protein